MNPLFRVAGAVSLALWLGACGGGQNNGECTKASECDDNNACTTDTCSANKCEHAAVDVDDHDACTADTCDPETGVAHAAVNVDDNDACTTDSCDPATGVAHADVVVDDNDACTVDACDPVTGVSHTAAAVDDGDACTADACDAENGVTHTAVTVDDGDACTADACDPATGVSHTPVAVDDSDACTADTCDPVSGVAHTPVSVDDGTACTVDACDPVAGVTHTPVNLDDNDACTADACDPVAGVTHTAVNVDDNDACTVDACNAATGVSHTPVAVDDSNACTVDSCNPVTGVAHTPVNVDDNNVCTTDSCDPATGVAHVAVSVDDNNVCTTDSCDPATGPAHVAISVDDGNACTADACDPSTGVSHTAINFDDNDVCTTDSCDPATGPAHVAVSVDDGNACTADACDPSTGVSHTAINVDDNDVCTTDSCDPATGPAHVAVSIDDGNACTADACDPSTGVSHTAINIDDNNVCTTDSCDPATGPAHVAVSVDDSNACTVDSCDPVNGPQHAALNPDDGNACTTDSCDPATGPQHAAVDPDDGNACTTDSCDPATGPVHVAVNPDDGNACTTDACDPALGPTHVAVNTDDNNLCTTDSCDPATGVAHTPVSVDDSDACTLDACDPQTGVTHVAMSVDDSNACTADSCDPATGVAHTPVNTDDNNSCTADSCDPATGAISHDNNAIGSACTENGGGVCTATATCVQCLAATDCSGTDTECSTRTCTNNVCGTNNAPAGFVLTAQDTGDCQEKQCDGSGAIVSVAKDTDLPVDNKQCTTDVCTNGVASNPGLPAGTGCTQGGELCDGTGGCGYLVAVSRVGTGAAALSNISTAAFVDQRFTTNGAVFNSIALPTAAAGQNLPFSMSGTSTSEGELTRSADGHFLMLAGYAAAPGSASSISGSLSSVTQRAVARIDSAGVVNTTTTLGTSAFSGNSPRGVTSSDGVSIWVSGTASSSSNGGVWYTTLGSTTATRILATPSNARWLNIYDGQLYGSSGSGAFVNVFTIGTGLPTTTGQTATSLPGMLTSGASPHGFVMLDLSSAIAGLDTMYVADDGSFASGGGVQKYTWDGSTWTQVATFTSGLSTGVRGLAAWKTSGGVAIAATTVETTGMKLVYALDTGTGSPAFTTATVAPTNTAFRGVSQLPLDVALNETDTAPEADYCVIQFPQSLSVATGQTTANVYGRIFETGVTEAAGAPAGVIAQLGYGPNNSDPRSSASWRYVAMTYNVQVGNDDEFQGSFTAPAPGTYMYTVRFSQDNGASWTYCDVSGAGSNTGLTFEPAQLAVMNVTP